MISGFGEKKELEVYSLKKDDILYFLHIPKAGGTTLIEMLDKYFEPETVLKLHEWPEVLTNMPIDFSKYRFIRGHFGYNSILRLLPKKPICITMLREPVKLVISGFKMVQRQPEESKRYSIPKNLSLSELITNPNVGGMKSTQTHWLLMDDELILKTRGLSLEKLKDYHPEDDNELFQPRLPAMEYLALAKKRILEFAFFGLVEKMEESLFLLHYQFGWKPTRDVLHKNISPSNQDSKITPEAMEKILYWTRVDRELYDYSRKIFNSRYSQMIKELKENYYQSRYDKMEENDYVFEMLVQRYKESMKEKI